MIDILKCLHAEESGQDLVEFALIGLVIALGAVTGMGKLAASINSEFTKVASRLG
jgi:Flp pilus assembly pilin Flp